MSERNRRSSYSKITSQLREELIERVLRGGQSIKTVANQIGVNISTGKAILKVYQEEGRIGKKQKRNKVINVVETFTFLEEDENGVRVLADTKVQESKMSLKRNENFQSELLNKSKEKAKVQMEQFLAREVVDPQQVTNPNQIPMLVPMQLNNTFLPYYFMNLQGLDSLNRYKS